MKKKHETAPDDRNLNFSALAEFAGETEERLRAFARICERTAKHDVHSVFLAMKRKAKPEIDQNKEA